MIIKSFPERIKEFRESLGLNQYQFSKKINLSRERVRQIESLDNKKGISFRLITDIASIFDVIPVGFYFYNKEKWNLDILNNKKFWNCTLDNYVGEIIKKYRIIKGINQDELAKEVSLRSTTISYYETGRNVPASNNLEKICYILYIKPDYFLEKKVRFDKGDFKNLKKTRNVLKEYLELSNDPEEIKNILIEARKLDEIYQLLKIKYNTLKQKVIVHR
jgi:transcriptional regulator with XRE-family HTH domain